MYVSKAKRTVELQELKENLEKKERMLADSRQSVIDLIPVSPVQESGPGLADKQQELPDKLDGSFHVDELPDGFCISPHRVVRSPSNNQSAVRTAEVRGQHFLSSF